MNIGGKNAVTLIGIDLVLTHPGLQGLCGTHLIFPTIDSMAAHYDGCSARDSSTLRMARSRTSGENFGGLLHGSVYLCRSLREVRGGSGVRSGSGGVVGPLTPWKAGVWSAIRIWVVMGLKPTSTVSGRSVIVSVTR